MSPHGPPSRFIHQAARTDRRHPAEHPAEQPVRTAHLGCRWASKGCRIRFLGCLCAYKRKPAPATVPVRGRYHSGRNHSPSECHSTIFPGLEKRFDTAQAKTSHKLSTVLHSSLVHVGTKNALITGITGNVQEVRRAPKKRL